jgi:uncharacterized protein YbcV (DUF1398 family)
MDIVATRECCRECCRQSVAGNITFPEVVKKLTSAGVESYYADLALRQKTYYMPDGETHIESFGINLPPVAQEPHLDGIKAALLAIQSRQIKYVEFLHRIIAAGVRAYIVFLNGKKAVYICRNGELYTENFPQAK